MDKLSRTVWLPALPLACFSSLKLRLFSLFSSYCDTVDVPDLSGWGREWTNFLGYSLVT